MMRKIYSIDLLLVAVLVCVAGCSQLKSGGSTPGKNSSPEVVANESIAGANAFLVTLAKKHPECGTVVDAPTVYQAHKWNSSHVTTGVCPLIDHGVGTLNSAIDATEVYCSSPEFDNTPNAKCSPPDLSAPGGQLLLGKLQSAVGNLNTIIADIKTAVKGEQAPAPPTAITTTPSATPKP